MSEQQDIEEMDKIRRLARELTAIQDRAVASADRVLKRLSAPPPSLANRR